MQQRTATFRHIAQNTPSTKVFRVKVEPAFDFVPGQFLTLLIEKDGTLLRRPYSIASLPGDAEVELAIKLYPQGQATPLLFEMQEGATLGAIGPFGRFTYEEQDAQPVLLGAGSGIAPLYGMIRHGLALGHTPLLFYSNKSHTDVIYADELASLAHNHKALTYVQTFTQDAPTDWQGPTGRLTQELLAAEIGSNLDRFFYVCGPPAFVASCIGLLHQLGVPNERIKQEAYD